MKPMQVRRWSVTAPVIEFEPHLSSSFEEKARESYVQGLKEIIRAVLEKNEEGAYIYVPPGEITVRVESQDWWHKFIFDCVFDRSE